MEFFPCYSSELGCRSFSAPQPCKTLVSTGPLSSRRLLPQSYEVSSLMVVVVEALVLAVVRWVGLVEGR